ncbi:nuclear transport factor 2 family protein [Streptomyces sp. NPDC102274]|uniref:nuclear transport factor 2 family protein n=1 Tax=Streptomyces sp. NPDC102274 TaxID=3366151 RepID=UPI003821AF60
MGSLMRETDETDRTTPAALYRHSLRLLVEKDMDGWVGLWAEDGLFEFPFAPPGAPARIEGREAVADYIRDYPQHIDIHDIPYLEIHETRDPETIVVEMRTEGLIVATGEPFDFSYIAVVTVRHGRITRYRDYWNPQKMPASMKPTAPATNPASSTD